MKLCLCGCGKEVSNEKNKYIAGHNGKDKSFWLGKTRSEETKLKISKSMKGIKHSVEVLS